MLLNPSGSVMPMPILRSSSATWSVGDRIASFQNLLGDRAGVFRVNVDLPAAKRLPKNDCAAHSLAVFGGNAGFG